MSQLELFYENIPIPIQFFDKNWCITDVNPCWVSVMGYEKSEVLGKNFIEFLIDEEIPRFHTILEGINNERKSFSFVCKLKHKTGKLIFAGYDGIYYSDEESGTDYVYCGFKDITTTIDIQKDAQKALQESELRYRELQDNISIGIFRVSPQGSVEYANSALFKIFGIENPDDIIGQSSLLFYAEEDDRYKILSKLEDNKNKDLSLEIRFKRLDRSKFWGRLNVKAVFDQKGELLYRDGTVQDISQIKKAEEELIQARNQAINADYLKSTFLANMSHEIRTPMNAILGFSELLLDPDIPEDQKSGFSSLINSNGNILMNLIDDIIDISKIEAGETSVKMTTCLVYPILADLEIQFRGKIKRYNKSLQIKLIVDSSLKSLSIISDAYRLRQIMTNLLDNAVKFTKNGELSYGMEIRQLENDRNVICLFVQDTGIGIPKNMHKAIFEQFRQVDQSPTRKYGGTGLGLHICKRLVELLGGEIYVDSDTGKGARFEVLLGI